MSFDLESWSNDLNHSIGGVLEQAITTVTSRLPATEIVGVGIATDADATSIVALANSRHHLNKMTSAEPEFAIDSRWHLGEWDMDVTQVVGAGDPLEPTRAELERAKQLITASAGDPTAVLGMREFRMAVWSGIASAMAESVAHGFFDRWSNAVRVFLPLDADVPEEQIAAWNSSLNRPAEIVEIRKFLQLDDGDTENSR